MEELKRAKELLKTDPESGISALRALIHANLSEEDVARVKEGAVLALGEILAKQHRPDDLALLVEEIRPLFNAFPKAKTAKIVRSLIDYSALIPNSLPLQIKLCEDSIEWCNQEKRAFLRQRLETK